jgi:adenylate cyclase
MGFKEDLEKEAQTFFDGLYAVTKGTAIPDVGDLAFGKVGRELDLAMLFVDIRESTKIVDAFRRSTAARMYKSFLYGVAKIALNRNSKLCSFNGDGVLAAFIGPRKNTDAVRAAMNLKWYGREVLAPGMKKYFDNNDEAEDLELDFGIGVHYGKVLVVKGGVRGDNNNDLVWVGNATNFAVRYSSLGSSPYNIHISESTLDEAKYITVGGEKRDVWEELTYEGETVYRTNYHWEP